MPVRKRAERGSSFYLGFLFLSAERREALSAVYAYCRLIDDIVDSGSLGREEAARMLGFWREEIGRLYDGRPTHSVAERLLVPLRRFGLPKEAFLEVIRGCELDLNRSRYETFSDLESYLKGVAGAVGLLSVEIFGYKRTPPEQIRQFALQFGNAFQLTNIIRDVGADLELGRVYLPLEDLKQAGYPLEALLHREHTPGFTRLMELEYERTRAFYKRARNLVDPLDRPSLLPAEVMARVYERLLEDIRQGGFRVFFGKAATTRAAKAKAVASAWLYSHGWASVF